MNEITRNDVKVTSSIVIPAFSSLYFLTDFIWNLPYTLEVCGVSAILAFLLGCALQVNTNRAKRTGEFYIGDMIVSNPEDGKILYSLELNGYPDDLSDKDEVTFKVIRN